MKASADFPDNLAKSKRAAGSPIHPHFHVRRVPCRALSTLNLSDHLCRRKPRLSVSRRVYCSIVLFLALLGFRNHLQMSGLLASVTSDAGRSQVADHTLDVNRVPVHDGRDRQVETRSAIALVLERAIGVPTLTVHVDRLRQKVPGPYDASPSIGALASFRSCVSKPSVNQP